MILSMIVDLTTKFEQYINDSYEEGIKFYEKYATDYGYTNINELALAIDYTPDELKEKIRETAENKVKDSCFYRNNK